MLALIGNDVRGRMCKRYLGLSAVLGKGGCMEQADCTHDIPLVGHGVINDCCEL